MKKFTMYVTERARIEKMYEDWYDRAATDAVERAKDARISRQGLESGFELDFSKHPTKTEKLKQIPGKITKKVTKIAKTHLPIGLEPEAGVKMHPKYGAMDDPLTGRSTVRQGIKSIAADVDAAAQAKTIKGATKGLGKALTKTLGPFGALVGGVMTGYDIAKRGNIYGQEDTTGRDPGVLDPTHTGSLGTKVGQYLTRTAGAVGQVYKDVAQDVISDPIGAITSPTATLAKGAVKGALGVMDAPLAGLESQPRTPDAVTPTSSIQHRLFPPRSADHPDAIAQGRPLTAAERASQWDPAPAGWPSPKVKGKPLTQADRDALVAQRTGEGSEEIRAKGGKLSAAAHPEAQTPKRKGTTRAEIEKRQREDEEIMGRKIY